MTAPSPRIVNLSVALLCALWGSTWVVIRGGLADLPPLTSAGLRFLIAGLLMAWLVRLLGRFESGAPPARGVWVLVGVLNFAVSYGVVYWVEQFLPSGLVAVLWGVFPLLMAASGHLFLPGERLRGLQWLGFAAGFSGIVLLFSTDLQGIGAGAIPAAALLLLSPLVCAVGTTVVKRCASGTSSLRLNRNAMLLGSVLLLGAAAWVERDRKFAWSLRAWASIGYLAVFGTVVTFGVYFWLLRFAAANKLSLVSYVTPVVALWLGWLCADEPVRGSTLAGTALVAAGVLAALRSPRVGGRGAGPAEGGTLRRS
ncbi:MAG: EamA family transporter [Planctomycetes bacterium]|nr:EamA family transporter [Planctomycetota bacterium]